MSPDDRKWLEDAIKHYTFNDVDELTKTVKALQNHEKLKPSEIIELLQYLQELIEIHEANGLNLCLQGGMPLLLNLIIANPSDEVRAEACLSFSAMN